MKKIKSFLTEQIKSWKTIYPESKNIFNALNLTNFEDLKVVIIGQDPYHWEGQAHWLSFSVQEGITLPPSLKNIYKEIEDDIWVKKDNNGNLESWALDWVLLLNSILTVEKAKPASHSKIWWEIFTDKIIETISENKTWIIFLLWWSFAREKKNLVDTNKHHILECPHPSPFSVHRWFFWSKHFSKTNKILEKEGKNKINW
jgi:uracil-DNA glycosylase